MPPHRPHPAPDPTRLEENRRKYDSGLLPLLTDHLLSMACRRAPGKRGFCGTYLNRVAERLEDQLRRRFTLRELTVLAALLHLRENDALLQETPAEEQRSLLMRVRVITPAVRRTCGWRSEEENSPEDGTL